MRSLWEKGIAFVLVCLLLAGCSGTNETGSSPSDMAPSSTVSSPAAEPDNAGSPLPGGEGEEGEALPSAPPEQSSEEAPVQQEPVIEKEEENTEMKMNVQVGVSAFSATLEDNAAVDALKEMMREGPVTISMRDYSGFEKVGSLGRSLPTSDRQTTTQAGDIVLYTGNQIVMFYGSNSWSYTRLGRIDDLTGWEEALGNGNVTVILSLNSGK